MSSLPRAEREGAGALWRARGRTVRFSPRVVGSAWIATAQGVSLLSAFVLLKLVASVAIPKEFGAFTLVLAVAGASATLVFGPLGQWALRFYQESLEGGELRSYYVAAGIGALLGSTVLLLCATPFLFADGLLVRLGLTPVLVMLGLAIGVSGGIGDVCVFVANAALHRGVAGVLLVVQSAIRPLAVLGAWLAGGRTVESWALAIVGASGFFVAIEVAVLLHWDWKRFGPQRRSGEQQLSRLWTYTLPFLVWGLPSYAMSFGDRLLVGYLAGAAVVAQYVAMTAATIGVANGFDAMLNRVFEPMIFQRAGGGTDVDRVRSAIRLVNLAAGAAGILAATLGVLVVVAPGPVLRVFTSSRYVAGSSGLWLLALSGVALLVGRQFVLRGLIVKRPWVYLPAKVISAAVLAAGMLLLVPSHGIRGACVAMLVAQVVQLGVVMATNSFAVRPKVA